MNFEVPVSGRVCDTMASTPMAFFMLITLTFTCVCAQRVITASSNGLILNARLDPIICPNTCCGHVHSIHGALSFKPLMTLADVSNPNTQTSSNVKPNKSIYWMPAMYIFNPTNKMYHIVPSWSRAYYDSTSRSTTKPFPLNLRAVIGDNSRRRPWQQEDRDHVRWTIGPDNRDKTNWRDHGDWTYLRRAKLIPQELELNIECPDCLQVRDGKPVTDSADHRSHLAYSSPKGCPASHPYRIPQVRFEGRFRLDEMRRKLGAAVVNNFDNWILSNTDRSGASGHMDFIMGWPTELMSNMIAGCDDAKDLARKTCPIKTFFTLSHGERDNAARNYKPDVRQLTRVPDEEVSVVAKLPGISDPCRLVAATPKSFTAVAEVGENSGEDLKSGSLSDPINKYTTAAVLMCVIAFVALVAVMFLLVRRNVTPVEEHV